MSQRPRLVLISGWGTSARVWDGIAAKLPEWRIDALSWADCLRDSSRVIAAMGNEPCILGGWSLGAMLSLRTAIEMPHNVLALVLLGATARFPADTDYPGADARSLRAMRLRLTKDSGRVLRDFASQCATPDGGEDTIAAYLVQASGFGASELSAGLDCLGTLDLRDQLGQLRMPTLLLHGSDDRIVPPSSVEYLAGRLPDGRVRMFAGRGHALPFTAAGEVAGAIESVLHEWIIGE